MFLLISELWSQGNNFPPLNKGASEYLDLYPCEQSLPVSASVTGEAHFTVMSLLAQSDFRMLPHKGKHIQRPF